MQINVYQTIYTDTGILQTPATGWVGGAVREGKPLKVTHVACMGNTAFSVITVCTFDTFLFYHCDYQIKMRHIVKLGRITNDVMSRVKIGFQCDWNESTLICKVGNWF